MLAAGAHRLIPGHDLRHRINVFPVADGDTGHKLAFTPGGLHNDALRQRLDLAEARLVETGPVIGAHAGQRTRVVSRQATGA